MHEVELKSVVDDLRLRRGYVERAGGRLRFAGTMVDRYYTLGTRPDSGAGRMRVRTYWAPSEGWTELTWKGSARLERGYKVREELDTREIAWYVLVEVEGAPEAIEHAIQATGIPREQFTAEPLKEFLRRFEARTSTKALLE
ncbi:hypothetical protein HPP05_11200 [Corallococcus exiguus]|uniref:hypothetical protein n=1 Tax=Corallococcus TaxID=83461 RepID=UPI0011C3D8FD|nr:MULTISPECIES: hypothetical protein [Corallococcus]NPC70312.1 hypothetical protein [Corallococcus exiguus]